MGLSRACGVLNSEAQLVSMGLMRVGIDVHPALPLSSELTFFQEVP
jgi:hypothetical protein